MKKSIKNLLILVLGMRIGFALAVYFPRNKLVHLFVHLLRGGLFNLLIYPILNLTEETIYDEYTSESSNQKKIV